MGPVPINDMQISPPPPQKWPNWDFYFFEKWLIFYSNSQKIQTDFYVLPDLEIKYNQCYPVTSWL